jgi:hypothetical protein
MKERVVSNLKWMWFTIGGLCLILPILLPSRPNAQGFFQNPIATATGFMVALSFPSCVVGILPMLLALEMAGISPSSIQGNYLILLYLFALGYIQWFWIAPRIFRREKISGLQVIELNPGKLGALGKGGGDFCFFDAHMRTPVERVIDEIEDR